MKQRTALVTGANRGIGLAIATGLAEQGLRVLTAARTRARAQEAAEQVGGIAVELDLSVPRHVEAIAAGLEDEHGPIDILVNNAGVMPPGSALEATVEQLEDTLNVNAVSAFALIRAVGPAMKERKWGRIVNVSSGWGSFASGLGGPFAYSVSKATLNAITHTSARALGPHVKVNSVCPGWVRTRMGGMDATRSVEEGADTPIWLATLPDDGPTGGFFRRRQRIDW